MALRRSLRSICGVIRQIEGVKIQPKQLKSCLFEENAQKNSLVRRIQVRTFFKDETKDQIPNDGRIRVYYGILTPQIRAVKFFSLSSSVIGIIAQPFIYNQLMAMQNLPLVIAGCTFVGFFTFVTPFLLHFITKKYVTHLDYNEGKNAYIATTCNIFCQLKETEFKVEEVQVPEVPGMFTTFNVKGKGMFVDPRLFEDPNHYAKLMGYDKPLDFKLFETSNNETEKK